MSQIINGILEEEIPGEVHGGCAKAEYDWMLAHVPPKGWLLEIGTYNGAGAAYMAGRRPDIRLLSVDPFPARFQSGLSCSGDVSMWERLRHPNQQLLVGTSEDVKALLVQGTFEVVFIDGDHSREWVLRDLHIAAQMITFEGTIFCHDYDHTETPHIIEVKQAVDEWCHVHSWRISSRVIWTVKLERKR